MKKEYLKPDIQAEETYICQQFLLASVDETNSNVGMGYSGGGSGTARSRSFGGWDDEE